MSESFAPALTGRRLGVYQVQERIGAGGMGEVYRARDTRLGRDVAIKILPEVFTADPDRLARFEREARVLASLNHPNIGAIYGLEEADGVRALVLELVEGETLADRLHRGPMPVADALRAARQIADALDAAHEKGIVHRDLKPANIKITPDGTVKVLDFGLAKAAGGDGTSPDLTHSPTITVAGTREGVILGTAAYMSPEQARGQAVDKRTDIWAFGCVLYEMLIGRPAFPGATVSDTIAAILQQEPKWTVIPARAPAGIRRLLGRCLEKDLKGRQRDIGDVRLELGEIGVVEESSREERGASRLGGVSRGPAPWIVASVLCLMVGAAAWYAQPTTTGTPENPLANATFTRLTDVEGVERDAAISPDGQFVVFVSDRAGPFDVWLSQVDTGRLVNLTQGREPSLDAAIRVVGFAGGGTELWLHDSDPQGPLRLLPLLGGASRIFLGKSPAKTPPMNAAWSPDGQRIVYHTADPGDPMFVADRAGANARQIFVDPNPGIHNHWPVWSPDGRSIYFVRGNPAASVFDLWRISDAGGEPERLTHHDNYVAHPTPLGDSTLLYVARDEDESGPWLWALDLGRNTTRRISVGLEQYTSLGASADGRRLVTTVANPTSRLWAVPILDRLAVEGDVVSVSLPTVNATAPRFGGGALFYLSSRGIGAGLWRYEQSQAVEISKGADGALLGPAAISFDGRRVAFAARREGRPRLHLLTADGADLQPIGKEIEVQGGMSWSPDGAWVVTGGRDVEGPGLFKVPVDGGPAVRLVMGIVLNPVWSPDGSLIVYAGIQVGLYAPLRAVRPDGTAVDMPAIQLRRDGERVRFLPNGKGLIYMQGPTGYQDFWLLDLNTNRMRALTRLDTPATMRNFDVTPDGTRIVFDRLQENSDVVLIDLAR